MINLNEITKNQFTFRQAREELANKMRADRASNKEIRKAVQKLRREQIKKRRDERKSKREEMKKKKNEEENKKRVEKSSTVPPTLADWDDIIPGGRTTLG